MRIASFVALPLALGAVFCSTSSTPPLGKCCVLTASDQSTDCYCGTFAAEGGVVSTVVVSGSTCTVTITSEGGGGSEHLKGYPPAAVTDCMNPVGN
jgi:hypothetical protein